MKKAVIVLVSVLLSILLAGSALGSPQEEIDEGKTIFLQVDNPNAVVNDKLVLIDRDNLKVKPVIKNNRTLVPLRFVTENLDIEVEWDEAAGKAILTKDGKIVECFPNSSRVNIDNIPVQLDVAAQTIEGRLYIPLRAIGELFNQNVSFKKGIIMITELDTSIQDYSANEFIEIYSRFAQMLIENELKTNGVINRYELARILIDQLGQYHAIYISNAGYYIFPDAPSIPPNAYYHAQIATYLNLLDIKKADFEPEQGVSSQEITAIMEKYKHLLAQKPDLPVVKSQPDQQLSAAIQKQAKSTNNIVRVSTYDFSTGATIAYRGDERFYPASLTKVLYMLGFMEQAQAGNLKMQNTYTLKQADKYARGTWVGGTGTLQYQSNGNKYSYDKLLSLMISISDNVAANVILDTVGKEKINSLSKRFGLDDTMIYRKYYEMSSPLPANYTTVSDLTKMLVLLENRAVVNDSLSSQGIKYLKATSDKHRIARYTAGDVVIANKTGTLDNLSGDMALVYFSNREPIALTIVYRSSQGLNFNAADTGIGKLAKTIINHYNSQPNYALYVNGQLIDNNIRLRFINGRPFIGYHEAIGQEFTDKTTIAGKQYISLDSLTAGNKYTYKLQNHPQPAVVITKL